MFLISIIKIRFVDLESLMEMPYNILNDAKNDFDIKVIIPNNVKNFALNVAPNVDPNVDPNVVPNDVPNVQANVDHIIIPNNDTNITPNAFPIKIANNEPNYFTRAEFLNKLNQIKEVFMNQGEIWIINSI